MPPRSDEPLGVRRPLRGTVLVIDDDKTAREAVREGLEALGIRVLEAPDAEAGLQLIVQQGPDLVLCALELSGLDGFGVMARIRENPGQDGMPVVALASRGRLADMTRSRELGFRAHVVKPLTPQVLRMLLDTLL
jgi:two-component system cell cycle response regulator DivK